MITKDSNLNTPLQSEVVSARLAALLRALDNAGPTSLTSGYPQPKENPTPLGDGSLKLKEDSQVQTEARCETSRLQGETGMSGSYSFLTISSTKGQQRDTHIGATSTDIDIALEPLTKAGLNALSLQEGGNHYRKLRIQPVEYIHANGIGFIEGCIIKYITRWRDKGGLKDLHKAKHFIDILIELEKLNGA